MEEGLSKRSSLITLVLCLTLGQFGAHRFYVGKYITGLLFLLVGGTSLIMDIFGFGYSFIAKIIYFIFIILDIYALYSDSFTDSKGLLITDDKTLEYDSLEERERIIFERKTNKILVIIFGFVVYLLYFILDSFVF